MLLSLGLYKINRSKVLNVFILVLFLTLSACKKEKIDNETIPEEQPSPSILPVESPESYQNDIEEYEPTDSISQDSDGSVH